MAIRAVCECGKKFEAKDEYEGRRAICPSCKREFVFQRAGIPIFQDVLELPPPLPEPSRRFWKDPIIIYGWGTPLLALLLFGCYLVWPRNSQSLETRANKAVPNAFGPRNVERTPNSAKTQDQFVSRAAHAKIFMMHYLNNSLRKNRWLRDCHLVEMDVRPVVDEGRKISGLWGATALVSGTLLPPHSGNEPRNISIRWTGLGRIDPADGTGPIIWYDLADVIHGPMYREHPGPSEWTAEFRTDVRAAEKRMQEEHTRNNPSVMSEKSIEALGHGLERLAIEYNVSLNELQEILEATD
jgi:hypothetical protein